MYLLMRKNGVLVHIDEKVGVEFIDLKRMNIDKSTIIEDQVTLLDESTEDESQFLRDSINISDLRETRNSSMMMRDKEREYR